MPMASKLPGGDLPWAGSTHKVTWPYGLVLQDHVTDENHTSIVYPLPVATKLGSVGIGNEELPFINSHSPLITCSRKVTWNISSLISILQQDL